TATKVESLNISISRCFSLSLVAKTIALAAGRRLVGSASIGDLNSATTLLGSRCSWSIGRPGALLTSRAASSAWGSGDFEGGAATFVEQLCSTRAAQKIMAILIHIVFLTSRGSSGQRLCLRRASMRRYGQCGISEVITPANDPCS